MLSAQTIRDIQDYAAYVAAEEGSVPLAVWHDGDLPHLPFLGGYVPRGYRVATWAEMSALPRNSGHYDADDEPAHILVDSSGWGGRDEPALTLPELADYVRDNGHCHWAIVESGQFQVVVAAYIQDDTAEGTPAPDIEPCEYCGDVHGPLDDCEPCPDCGNVHPWSSTSDCPEDDDA